MQTGAEPEVRCDALLALGVPVVSFLSSQLPLFTQPPAISPEMQFQRVPRFRNFCVQFQQSLLSVALITQSYYRANSPPAPSRQHPVPACPLDHELLGTLSLAESAASRAVSAGSVSVLPASLSADKSLHLSRPPPLSPHNGGTLAGWPLQQDRMRQWQERPAPGKRKGASVGPVGPQEALSFSWN